jgi:twitching motility protein PilT
MGNGREIDKLLFFMHKNNASDLHLKVGSPPIVRVERQVRRLEMTALSGEQIFALVEPIMPERSKKEFEAGGSADFAYSVAGIGRYRVNVFRQRGSVSVAARRVRYDIPSMQALNLPPGVQQITQFDQGMCIIAGPTGSGKSTTLAAMLDHINHTRRCHILTIEDPIEYLYRDDKAFVNQREVGLDVTDFHAGLRYALREDPDVILVGEMRDYETFEIALQAAETGHLVFGTLHASSAAGSIGRVLDLFPETRHPQIRRLLAFNLRAVLVQRLLPGATAAAKVVPAIEVMIVNPSVRKLIADGGDSKIPDVIRGGRQEGMQDMTQSLHTLVKSKLVTERTALDVAPNPEALQMLLRGITVGGSSGGIIG